ncbi:MAG: helix-turn-helix transcriptional regulator [Peptococcaceae bacterium]|nr:helix-turn-helix transcriptional regulator [Peptococcaceae bacterium]
MTVGERIKNRRKEQGITLSVLAEKCKLSISFLSDIEHGRRKPALDKLGSIAKGLETTVSFLLGEEPEEVERNEGYKELSETGERSLEFREVLEKIEGFEEWSHEDKQELLTYLKIKEKIRCSKPKKGTVNHNK